MWTALLTDDGDRRGARSLIDAIAADLLRRPEAAPGVGFAAGAAGLALAHHTLAGAADSAGAGEHRRAADRLLARVADALATEDLGAGLYEGFTGAAWSYAHVHGDAALAEELDDLLLVALDQPPPWPGPFDLVSGLVGLGTYAAARISSPQARRCLERVVAHLGAVAVADRGGLAWRSSPAHLDPIARARFPGGLFDAGLAHGVPGVVALLAEAAALGIEAGDAARLLEGAMAWLAEVDRPGGAGFPYQLTDGAVPAGPARSAWCYGDPGVAVALVRAGLACRRDDWCAWGIQVALRAADRGREEAQVCDAMLCHGAAGLGHIYNRLHQLTGEPALARVARHWLRTAIEMRDAAAGGAGYATWRPRADRSDLGWVATTGLLDGSAGVALALAAALDEREPEWDHLLLLSSSCPAVRR